MAEDLYENEYFIIGRENGFLSQFGELFNIPECEASNYFSYDRKFFGPIQHEIHYDEDIREFTKFAFAYDVFADMLASRKEETYILSKIIKYNFDEGFIETTFNAFLHKLQGDIICHDLAKQRFEAWGGIEKLKTLSDLTLTTQIRVERISNPQKITYGSEGGSMGKRRRE